MNEELQKNLSTILDLIAKGMTVAGDFAIQQLPDIAQQYVAYGRVWNTAMFSVLAIVTLLWLVWVGKVIYMIYINENDVTPFVTAMVSLVLSFTLLPATYTYAKDTALVWFAPKIWLIQEAASLVKSPRRR